MLVVFCLLFYFITVCTIFISLSLFYLSQKHNVAITNSEQDCETTMVLNTVPNT